MIGLWIGYILLGLSVPSLIITHDYYNLILVPIVALSLTWIGEQLFEKISESSLIWRGVFLLITMLALAYPAWTNRVVLVSTDYRDEIKGWKKMGKELPKDARLIGITHDYGTRLMYYGKVAVALWPYVTDQEMHVLAGGNADMNDPAWAEEFKSRTAGYDYFIVTVMGELDVQPVLKEVLYNQFSYQEGDGYILFDLHSNN